MDNSETYNADFPFVRTEDGWLPIGGVNAAGESGGAAFKVLRKPTYIDGGLVVYAYQRGLDADGRKCVRKYDFEFVRPLCKIYCSGYFDGQPLRFHPLDSDKELECVKLDGVDMPENALLREIYSHILINIIEKNNLLDLD